MRSRVRQIIAAIAPLSLSLLLCGAVAHAEDQNVQAAKWTPRELRFTYMGFTTRFSCEGLQSQVRSILLQLGARPDDLKVNQFACTQNAGVPAPFPAVHAKFSVLEPVSADEAGSHDASSPVITAHWQTVQLRLDSSPVNESGMCELVEQVKTHILPLFATRNLDFRQHCVPHQLSSRGTTIRVDVMKAPLKQAENNPALK
jgi:hypothetical protein